MRRGNAHFKGQEGETVWGGRGEDGEGKSEGKGEERRGLLLLGLHRGTWDTLHTSTSVRERLPHSRSNVNLISSGWKEANNNPKGFFILLWPSAKVGRRDD